MVMNIHSEPKTWLVWHNLRPYHHFDTANEQMKVGKIYMYAHVHVRLVVSSVGIHMYNINVYH